MRPAFLRIYLPYLRPTARATRTDHACGHIAPHQAQLQHAHGGDARTRDRATARSLAGLSPPAARARRPAGRTPRASDAHRRPQTARQQDTLTASRHSPLRHETGRHLTPVVTRDPDELSIRRGRVAFTRRLRSRDETRHRLTGRSAVENPRAAAPNGPREDSLMITVILRINHLVAWRMYAIENAPHVAKMSTSRASKPTHAPSEPMMSPFMP